MRADAQARPFWEPLSEGQRAVLFKDIGASEDTLRRDVATLRAWVDMQPHLPCLKDAVDVDLWLRMYLVRCKNSLERAKEAVDMLLTSRTNMPEFFRHRDPAAADVQGSFDTTLVATMPRLTPEGHRVHYYAYPSADSRGFNVEALFRRVLMIAELVLRDDLSSGEIIVLDLANGSASRFRDFTIALPLFTKFIRGGLKMFPVRLKRFHIVNLPPFLGAVVSLLGHVLKDKLFSRVVVHPPGAGLDLLRKELPKECIPEDYAGEGPSLARGNELWRSLVVENRDWFLAQENVKADESKRVGIRPGFIDDFHMGCPGSFRSLAVD